MTRNGKKARRLVVDGDVFLWSLSHRHHALGDGRYQDCCDVLELRLFKAAGRLRIAFRPGPGRFLADGLTPSGQIGAAGSGSLNLHEPGTARALLDEARARGWRPASPLTEEVDGWPLFDAVTAHR